jgi:hypothetical protein
MERDKAKTLAKNMRKVALFIQDNHAEIPDHIDIELSTHLWSWAKDTNDIPAQIGSAMRAALMTGADIKKEYSDNYFRCYLTFGIDAPKIIWRIVSERDDVCTKKIVGTKTVTKMVAPEGDWTEQEVTEDIVEWECHSLLKVGEADEAS